MRFCDQINSGLAKIAYLMSQYRIIAIYHFQR